MKSLMLKDLYNIRHTAKSMLFILLVFAFAFIPNSYMEFYIFMCALVCNKMVITTFSFDDHSNWMQYAMVMPVSRNTIAVGKFMLMLAFTAAGTVFGLITGIVGAGIVGKIALNPANLSKLLLAAWITMEVVIVQGSISLALVFKFGAERGRVLILASCLISIGIAVVLFRIFGVLGIVVTDQMVRYLLLASPLMILALCFWMYRISCHILSKQEL